MFSVILLAAFVSVLVFENRIGVKPLWSYTSYVFALLILVAIVIVTIRITINSTLSIKIVSYFLLVTVIPITIIAFAGQAIIKGSIEKVIRRSIHGIAHQTAMNYDLFIHENLNKLRIEANIPDFCEFLLIASHDPSFKEKEKRINAILGTLKRHDPIYIQYYALLNLEGRVVTDTRGIGDNTDYSSELHFVTPIRTGLPYVSDILPSHRVDKPMLYFSSAVRDQEGRIAGVLTLCYDATILQKILVRNTAREELPMSIYLIDDLNVMLCHNQQRNDNFTLLYNIDSSTMSVHSGAIRYYKRNPEHFSDSTFLEGLSSGSDFFNGKIVKNSPETELFTQVSLSYKPWKVVVGYSETDIKAAQYRQMLLYIVLFMVTITLTIMVALLLSRRLVSNINSISQFAANMQRGDYSGIELVSKDEFAELGRQLNDMMRSVDTYQKRLRESNQRLQQLLDTIPDAVFAFNEQGNIFEWNMQFAQIFGYERQDGVTVSVQDVVREFQSDASKHLLVTIREGYFEEECSAIHRGGRTFPVLIRISRFEFVNMVGFLAVVTDISARRIAEEMRREADKFNEILFSNTSIAMVVMDEKGRFVRCNSYAIHLYGFDSVEQVLGKSPVDVSAPRQYDGSESGYLVKQIVDEVLERWTPKEFEWLHQKPWGEQWDGYIVLYPFYHQGKRMLYFTLQDFTLRKKSEEALRQSEEKYRQLFEVESDAILLYDYTTGSILDVNMAAIRLYNYSKEDFIQLHFNDLLAGGTAEDSSAMLWHRKFQGEAFPVELSRSFFTWGGRRVCIAAVRDISQRVRYENELMAAKEKAEESDRLKTSFLANISHEIRTPMNGIMGFAELLLNNKYSDEEIKYFSEIIYSGCTQLLNLINDIINISQIESGQVRINYTPTDIGKVVLDIQELYRPSASRKGIELRVQLPDKQLVVESDETKLRQILSNLVNNAIKFTDEGVVELGCSVNEVSIDFFVRDQGVGIDPSDQEVIFERFRQGHTGSGRSYGGTGLGLAICKSLVEMLGGTIWVESKVGEGSLFRFTLPKKTVMGIPETTSAVHSPADAKLAGKRVLIVEDEETNTYYLVNALEPIGIQCVLARNGEEAVDIIHRGEPVDLILMDMKMPVMDGFEATSIIRKMRPWLPVIAQTAYAMAEEKAKAIRAGCVDYITKPIELKKLISLLSVHLGSN